MQIGDMVIYKGSVGKVVNDYDNKDILRFLPAGHGRYYSSDLTIITRKDIEYATFGDKINYIKKEFTWGKISDIHIIGDYQIIEYIKEDLYENNRTSFHTYVDFNDTCCGYGTLEQAIIGVIAYKFDGSNSQAAKFFSKMIGLDKYSESVSIMNKISE